MLYEYGHAVPQGPVHLKRIVEIIEAETRKIAAQAALTPTVRRLQTMPPSRACTHALPGSERRADDRAGG